MTSLEIFENLNRIGFNAMHFFLSILWQSSLLFLAALALSFALRKRRATARRAIWIIALLATPLLPLATSGASRIGAPQAPVAVLPEYQPPLYQPEVQPLPPDALTPVTASIEIETFPAATIAQPPVPVKIQNYPWALLLCAYLLGATLFLGWVFMGYYRIRQWIKSGRPVTDERVLKAFAQAQPGNLPPPALILESDLVPAPVTVGLLHHKVLLPSPLFTSLSDADLFALAVHETEHLRRRDPLVLTLVALVRAFLFFHPLVWVAARQISNLAEICADDAVIDATKQPVQYARMLAHLAEGLPPRPLSTEMATGLLFSRSAFLQRVEAILGDRTRIRKLSRFALAGVLMMLLGTMAVALSFPLVEKPKESKTFAESKPEETPKTSEEKTTTGRIKGKVWFGKPIAGATVHLRPNVEKDPDNPQMPLRTTTDEQGRFVFENVEPGKAQLDRVFEAENGSLISPVFLDPWIQVEPGKTTHATIGGRGRPVIGKIGTVGDSPILPYANAIRYRIYPEAPHFGIGGDKVMWEIHSKFLSSPEGAPYSHGNKTLSPDGTFRIDRMPEGNFWIQISIMNSDPKVEEKSQVLLTQKFTVPKTPNGESEEPLDLGEYQVTIPPDIWAAYSPLSATGRIEGKIQSYNNTTYVGMEIFLRPVIDQNTGGKILLLKTKIDKQGRFVFENIKPGAVELGYEYSIYALQQHSVGYSLRPFVQVKAGETTNVTIGAHGRPVIGKIGMADKSPISQHSKSIRYRIYPEASQFGTEGDNVMPDTNTTHISSSGGISYSHNNKRIASNGTFQLSSMPGTFFIEISILNSNPEAKEKSQVLLTRKFTIPNTPIRAGAEPFDLGEYLVTVPTAGTPESPTPTPRTEPVAPEPNPSTGTTLPNGVNVKFQGVATYPDFSQWRNPDGSKADRSLYKIIYPQPPAAPEGFTNYEFAVSVQAHPGWDRGQMPELWEVPAGKNVAQHRWEPVIYSTWGWAYKLRVTSAMLPSDLEKTDVNFLLALGPWKDVKDINGDGSMIVSPRQEFYPFKPVEETSSDRGTPHTRIDITITKAFADRHAYRVIAIKNDGTVLRNSDWVNPSAPDSRGEGYEERPWAPNERQWGIKRLDDEWKNATTRKESWYFHEVALKDIDEFILQTCPYTRIEFRDIALQPGTQTAPTVNVVAPEGEPDTIFEIPISGRISAPFGWVNTPRTRSSISGRYHSGIDVSAPYGTLIPAAADGVVTASAYSLTRGNYIVIKHGNGYETRYFHLSKMFVKIRDIVRVGQEIGLVGSTGISTGPHLHFEIHKDGKAIDPSTIFPGWAIAPKEEQQFLDEAPEGTIETDKPAAEKKESIEKKDKSATPATEEAITSTGAAKYPAFIAPVKGHISSLFGWRKSLQTGAEDKTSMYNPGIDIATG